MTRTAPADGARRESASIAGSSAIVFLGGKTPRTRASSLRVVPDTLCGPTDIAMLPAILELPLWVSGPAIVGALCVYALLGLSLVRRRVLPRLRVRTEDSECVGAMVQAVMVFYGLAVALIAVNVWQTHSRREQPVSACRDGHLVQGDDVVPRRRRPGCSRPRGLARGGP